MILALGIQNIEKRILKLTDHLIEALTQLGLKLQTPTEPQYRSGIVNFKINNPQKVAEKLKNKDIIVSARAHGIRVSPHFYNTEAETDKLIQEIKTCE